MRIDIFYYLFECASAIFTSIIYCFLHESHPRIAMHLRVKQYWVYHILLIKSNGCKQSFGHWTLAGKLRFKVLTWTRGFSHSSSWTVLLQSSKKIERWLVIRCHSYIKLSSLEFIKELVFTFTCISETNRNCTTPPSDLFT